MQLNEPNDMAALEARTATADQVKAVFEQYGFRDLLGHPLINCRPFVGLVEWATGATPEGVARAPGTMTVQVFSCARCGEDHEVTFERLINPPDQYDWWGMCPNANQPVWCRQGGIPPFVEVEVAKLEPSDLTAEAVRRRVARLTRRVVEETVAAVCEGDEQAAQEAQARFCEDLVDVFNEIWRATDAPV